jgi:hypothetical protein
LTIGGVSGGGDHGGSSRKANAALPTPRAALLSLSLLLVVFLGWCYLVVRHDDASRAGILQATTARVRKRPPSSPTTTVTLGSPHLPGNLTVRMTMTEARPTRLQLECAAPAWGHLELRVSLTRGAFATSHVLDRHGWASLELPMDAYDDGKHANTSTALTLLPPNNATITLIATLGLNLSVVDAFDWPGSLPPNQNKKSAAPVTLVDGATLMLPLWSSPSLTSQTSHTSSSHVACGFLNGREPAQGWYDLDLWQPEGRAGCQLLPLPTLLTTYQQQKVARSLRP